MKAHLQVRSILSAIALVATGLVAGCATRSSAAPDPKQQVIALLKSFETGDRSALAVIDPHRYIQHDLRVADGLAGLQARLQSGAPGATKVDTVRAYVDGDYVFTQSEYAFSGRSLIGFDVFRFEGGRIVEHWDNLQEKAARPSPSGHTMLDGPVVASDLDRTAANKALMQAYMDDLLAGRRERFASYFDGNRYIQHSPLVADDLTGLFAGLQALAKEGRSVKYTKVHKVLGQGDFVLVMAEGSFGDQPSAYYDFYRIHDGRIAEHWDTIEPIPPRAEWKNANGKF